ncbi:MAG: hypothetical protein V1755_02735, partial [Chloroflexota bacterium]
MDYNLLRAELAKPAYIGKSGQAAADLLNAATVTRARPLPVAELARLVYNLGIPARLHLAIADDRTAAAVGAAANALLDLLTGPCPDVNAPAALTT